MDNQQQSLKIDKLGLSDEQLQVYLNLLQAPQGLILVTGPTGSGKTVTLYSGLNQINQDERNICSVEDPIEIPLCGINQTQINTKTGLSFAQILRSLLRQDPDVMMIGEIRDKETAEIAIQAAQTGHLVLSTLHTNSGAETIVRLNQIGIENYLIASSLKLIIAQRLVRKLCAHCKVQASTPVVISDNNQPVSYSHFMAQGCDKCVGGYLGRIGIYEFLEITPQIQTLLLSEHDFSLNQINEVIGNEKIPSLYKMTLGLISQGLTSFSELDRVFGLKANLGD